MFLPDHSGSDWPTQAGQNSVVVVQENMSLTKEIGSHGNFNVYPTISIYVIRIAPSLVCSTLVEKDQQESK